MCAARLSDVESDQPRPSHVRCGSPQVGDDRGGSAKSEPPQSRACERGARKAQSVGGPRGVKVVWK